MTRRLSLALVFVLLAAALASAQAAPPVTPEAALITHQPLNEVFVGEASFSFEVTSPDRAGKIVVHVRPDAANADATPLELEALRSERGYGVQLPAAQVQLPGFAYWVVERMPDGSQRSVFAEAEHPHHVRVIRLPEAQEEHERLQLRGGERSSVMVSAEGVDYGDRRLATNTGEVHDRYYRAEISYAYGVLSRVEEIRLSVVRVRGQFGEVVHGATPDAVATRELSPGVDYGRAQVTLLAGEYVRLRGALLLGASQQGFEYGGAGAIMLGYPFAENLELSVESMTTLGATGSLRLGFRATKNIPMGAAVEVSSFPLGGDTGVRLLYDVGYRFSPITTLSLRAGYQGRTSVTGGPSLGVTWQYGF